MQKPEPRISPRALCDLDDLYDGVLEASGSEKAALSTYEGLLSAVRRIAPFPFSAPSVQGRTGIACDYRWVEYKGWLGFFHVEADGGIVLDRVLWGRSEWGRLLGLRGTSDE